MKKLLFAALFVLISTVTPAQEYKTALGIRLGAAYGFTIKHFIKQDVSLEGILVTRWNSFYLTGLYEKVMPLSEPDNLYWYYGGGAHIGVWNGDETPRRFNDPDDDYTVIGIDGILGMEYTFDKIPINLSLDWKPGFNLFRHTGFWGDEIALSIRFVLSNRST